MPSDSRRVREVMRHIQSIKASDYPAIVSRDELYRIVERPWKELQESCKLAILQDAVDWSGVSNRDQAHILLSEIDPGRISDAQRSRLIDMAGVKPSFEELLEGKGMARERDLAPER